MEMLHPLHVAAQSQSLYSYPGIKQTMDYIGFVQRQMPPPDDAPSVSRALESVVTVHVHRTRSFKRMFPGARGLDVPEAYQMVAENDPSSSTGSGFFVRSPLDGLRYVLTSAHTVARAADSTGSIWIETFDGRRFPATLRFADSFFDQAILTVDGALVEGLPAIPFRKEPPRLTERVYTIGTPLGRYPCSVSEGIVSGFDRFFSDETGRFGYVQTTAPAVPGNSGGPVIDRQGRLIGMVTKIGQDMRANGVPHLTFALEGHHCERLLSDFIQDGAVRRPWLGAEFVEVEAQASEWTQPAIPVVRIRNVLPGQALDQATNGGCHLVGAQVLALNRTRITSLDALYQAIEGIDPATQITLTVLQAGDTCQILARAEVLSDIALISIANHFVAQHPDLLSGQLHAGQPVELAVYTPHAEQPAQWEKYRIIAAGFNTADRGHLWEVIRPEELGAIIRLFAVHGKVQLVLVPANTTKFSPGDIEYHTFYYAPDSFKVLYH
jgi:S1-C subfamily serine protease